MRSWIGASPTYAVPRSWEPSSPSTIWERSSAGRIRRCSSRCCEHGRAPQTTSLAGVQRPLRTRSGIGGSSPGGGHVIALRTCDRAGRPGRCGPEPRRDPRAASAPAALAMSWPCRGSPGTSEPPAGADGPLRAYPGCYVPVAARCARGDLNPHDLTVTRPSTVRVCQFRHSRVGPRVIAPAAVRSLAVPRWGRQSTQGAGRPPGTSIVTRPDRARPGPGRAGRAAPRPGRGPPRR